MGNRLRCCKECCEVSDDFNRTDSTDIGPWEECSGDWEIDSNELSVDGDDAVAVFLKRCKTRGLGSVELTNIANGKSYRLICGIGTKLDPCSTAYTSVIAEYEVSSGGSAKLRIIESDSDDQETILAEADENVPFSGRTTLTLCVGAGRVTASITESFYPLWVCAVPTGWYWGLGTGEGTGEHRFDDMHVIEHYSTNKDCPQCICGCDGNCLPPVLRWTIVADANCSWIDGATGLVYADGLCSWSSPEVTDIGCQALQNSLQFKFMPTEGPQGVEEYRSCSDDWEIEVWRYISSNLLASYTGAACGSCDPLNLVFGPFNDFGQPWDELCCEGTWVWDDESGYWIGESGTFYIVITKE